MKPYTYLIGWKELNLYYYGVRYSNNCDPSDLFITYFTSCKKVKELYNNYGFPDIITIRKIFNDKESAIRWEAKVLQRLKVQTKPYWINRNVAGAFKNKPEDYKNIGIKISNTRKLRKIQAWNKGLTKHTDDRVKKYSQTQKGRKMSEENRKKLRKPKSNTENMKKPKSDEHKKNISIGVKKYFSNLDNKKVSDRQKNIINLEALVKQTVL